MLVLQWHSLGSPSARVLVLQWHSPGSPSRKERKSLKGRERKRLWRERKESVFRGEEVCCRGTRASPPRQEKAYWEKMRKGRLSRPEGGLSRQGRSLERRESAPRKTWWVSWMEVVWVGRGEE